jgi:hypothetical protein
MMIAWLSTIQTHSGGYSFQCVATSFRNRATRLRQERSCLLDGDQNSGPDAASGAANRFGAWSQGDGGERRFRVWGLA